MNFTPNPAGIENLFAEIARKIEAADASLRQSHGGQPADEIEGPLDAAFQAIGVNLAPEDVSKYAQAVSDREPFEIKLQ